MRRARAIVVALKVFQRAQITVNDDGTVDVNGYGQPGRLLNVSRQ